MMKIENYGEWDCCALCTVGESQSPIHIHSETCEHTPDPLTYDYHETALHIVNNGNTVQFDYEPGSAIIYRGDRYDLSQFHFHLPGEHQIDDQTFAMEAHFVHKSDDGGAAVVGVMILESDTPHPAYAQLWEHLPATPHTENHPTRVHMNAMDLLPEDPLTHYYYEGSLTTPPCTEGIHWIVLQEPIYLSHAQIDTFRRLYNGNNRPLQPLNGRILSVTS